MNKKKIILGVIQIAIAIFLIWLFFQAINVKSPCLHGLVKSKCGEISLSLRSLILEWVATAINALGIIGAFGLFFKKRWGKILSLFFWIFLGILAIALLVLYIYSTRINPPKVDEISALTASKTPMSPMPTPTPADPTANWKTYSNSKYNVSFKYPSALTVKEIDPVKSGEASAETGNLLWVNVGNNFTVEILSKKPAPPYDYVSENYSQKQQVIFGTDKKSLTAYLSLNTTQGECYGISTVRGSCKDYFAVQVQGQKYWYIFTGVLANKAISKDELNVLSSAVIE